MVGIELPKGITVAPKQTASIVMLGSFQVPRNTADVALIADGEQIGTATISGVFTAPFEHFGGDTLSDELDPEMRNWGNAHMKLRSLHPKFSMRDKVSVVKFTVDSVFPKPQEIEIAEDEAEPVFEDDEN
jgi:hypothetical protein